MHVVIRTIVLTMGQDRAADAPPPPPLPRGRSSSSQNSQPSGRPPLPPGFASRTPQSAGAPAAESSGAAATVGSSPSTPTNPVEPSVDRAAQRNASLSSILAQARNLSGVLSGMASAFEALSNNSPAASQSSPALEILDELNTFRATIAATESVMSSTQAPETEEPETPVVSQPQPRVLSADHVELYRRAFQLGILQVGKGVPTVKFPIVNFLPNWLQMALTNFKGVPLGKYPSLSTVSYIPVLFAKHGPLVLKIKAVLSMTGDSTLEGSIQTLSNTQRY